MRIISLGLGVQSTALYYMSSMGELPRCDYAVFADTGREKSKTLKYLEFLTEWQRLYNGIPIVVVRKRNLFTDLLNAENSTGQRFASIPAYVKTGGPTEGMLRRQCTSEYKIYQVDQAIRDLYGLKPRQRTPITEVWKGITLDEIERLSIPQETWKIHIYPFVGYKTTTTSTERIDYGKKMRRNDVVNWYNAHGLLIPGKSACVFCPYHSDAAWLEMKENEPEDWEAAVQVDRAIRDSMKKKINNPVYLHDSCIPLEEVQFSREPEGLWRGECSGNCHI